jgi:hypothetical protein
MATKEFNEKVVAELKRHKMGQPNIRVAEFGEYNFPSSDIKSVPFIFQNDFARSNFDKWLVDTTEDVTPPLLAARHLIIQGKDSVNRILSELPKPQTTKREIIAGDIACVLVFFILMWFFYGN